MTGKIVASSIGVKRCISPSAAVFAKLFYCSLALRVDLSLLAMLSQPVCPTKALMWNRERCQAAITKVLEWDFDTIYATHGTCPIKHAKDAIRDEFQFLWD